MPITLPSLQTIINRKFSKRILSSLVKKQVKNNYCYVEKIIIIIAETLCMYNKTTTKKTEHYIHLNHLIVSEINGNSVSTTYYVLFQFIFYI